jgi:hypothetical protein
LKLAFLVSTINLSPQQLREAADLQEKILALQAELNELLGGEATVAAPVVLNPSVAATAKSAHGSKNGRKKRTMTASWKKALSLAAKARWAREKGAKPASELEEKPARRKISAAGRAAMAAAGRARWAKVRGEKKKAKAASKLEVPF